MLGFFFGGAPSSGELVLVFLAVLLLFGAKRLPNIARNMGKALEDFRRAARDVTDEIMRADTDTPRPPPRTLPRREIVDDEPTAEEKAEALPGDDGEAAEEMPEDDRPDTPS